MPDHAHYDLAFIAEDDIQVIDFTNFGYVYTRYVFATNDDGKSKAAQFSWLYQQKNIALLIQYIFKDVTDFDLQKHLIAHQGRAWVFDLTAFFKHVITKETAETNYAAWITNAGRQDSFDEFCRYVGLVDYLNRHLNKQHLMLCVFAEQDT